MEPQPGHVVLLGDSIFDNASYVGGGPDVAAQLREALPSGWHVTLCAIDGATTAGLQPQLARVPADASHLVVSIGGNDALHNVDLLSLRAASSDEMLRVFAHRVGGFERAYRTALGPVVARGLPVTICTIYNGALDAGTATVARVALALFNDVIIRFAIDWRLSAIELRAICTEPADYANPIEPSVRGGSKIAAAIARVVGGDRPADAAACIWGGSGRAGP
jgi:hypothetical protein